MDGLQLHPPPMRLLLLPVFITALSFPVQAAQTVWLSSLDLSKMQQGWGKPQTNQAVTAKPMSINGQTFDHGVGTHAVSMFWIQLAGGSDRFLASVGVDD